MMGTSVLNVNNETIFLKHRFQAALERLRKKAKPRWACLPNPTIFSCKNQTKSLNLNPSGNLRVIKKQIKCSF